jgi:UDP-GlcNAc:undecaprenyl-phosphate/decaprenyl-phosphate GlcNAc-1-phosphate transferase
MDKPNERSSHHVATPSLGGIAFFMVFIISLSFNNFYDKFNISMSILPGLTLLFFLGLKDDLVVLSPKTKLLGQIIACLFILANKHFSLDTLHGFLWIHDIHPVIGLILGLILMLGIINSFNLIDGIDGLAGTIGILIFVFFMLVFSRLNYDFLFLSALSMIGILIGFLFFNLSKNKKIFMGDTGSMQVGFIIAVMTMRLMTFDENKLHHLPFESTDIPPILIALLIVPVYDAARVMVMRILKGQNPFSAHRDHFHHLLIDSFKLSHWKVSLLIASFNLFFLATILIALDKFSLFGAGFIILLAIVLMTVCSLKLEKQIQFKLEKKELDKKRIRPTVLKAHGRNTRASKKPDKIQKTSF